MNMQDVVSYVDDVRPNDYSEAAKIILMSDLDGMVKDEIMKTYSYDEIMRVMDQAAYDLPTGVDFSSIETVFVDGSEIPKIDFRSFERDGYYLDSTGKIAFYPVPAVTDTEAGIRIVHQDTLTRYTQTDYDNDKTLLIPEPYSTLYAEYIMMRMNYLDKQYEDYNNDVTVFNTNLQTFAKWYNQKNPMNGHKIKNIY